MHLVIGALVVAFLWSVGSMSQKYILGTISPKTTLVVTGVLYGAAMIIYFLFNKPMILADLQKIDAKVWSAFAVLVVFGIIASQLLFYNLVQVNDIYKVSALTHVSPIFALILATLILAERPTPLHVLGIVFIVIGVILVGGTS